ncbi:MAG: carboxypeptidase M32, partial [Thermotogaceae bacterium]|nr:carboxypeptidase M32 [Thermotogaceae bacterium]
QMNAEIPDIKERTRRGEFSAILDWLNRKIHSAGALKDPMALCEQVTGERLNPAYYLEYLKGKYTKLYA